MKIDLVFSVVEDMAGFPVTMAKVNRPRDAAILVDKNPGAKVLWRRKVVWDGAPGYTPTAIAEYIVEQVTDG